MNVGALMKESAAKGQVLLAFLLDPEKTTGKALDLWITEANRAKPDLIFVGGSQLHQSVESSVSALKRQLTIPVVLFPGHPSQFSDNADALLLLSLISGRNAELLIGQQVQSARVIEQSGIEVLSVGYMLIDGDKKTAVERISLTKSLDPQNVDLIVDTALAGQQLGLQYIYLEAGSGAKRPVSPSVIKAVKSYLHIPLIVGGGIKTPEGLQLAYSSGADIVVIGNYLETHPEEMVLFSQAHQKNTLEPK